MLNIDLLTIGNEFKNDTGDIYKVTSNWGENGKIYIEFDLVDQTPELNENLEPINT